MGGGDIKLLAMIGAFLGWKPALLTIMIGSLTGSIIGISLISCASSSVMTISPLAPSLCWEPSSPCSLPSRSSTGIKVCLTQATDILSVSLRADLCI